MILKHPYIIFIFAVLKKSYLSNVVLYFCQWSLSKDRTKYVCWDSKTLDLLYICCNTFLRFSSKKLSSGGLRNKCKLTSSSGSQIIREYSNRDLPNFVLSAIDNILCPTLCLSSEINIRTPYFSRSKTSDIRGSLSFSANKGYPRCWSCKTIKENKMRNYQLY